MIQIHMGRSMWEKEHEFQQDNAPIHVSKATRAFFQESNMQVMDWPAYSPDLNPIENVWGLLSRSIYGSGRQYDSVGSHIHHNHVLILALSAMTYQARILCLWTSSFVLTGYLRSYVRAFFPSLSYASRYVATLLLQQLCCQSKHCCRCCK